MLSTKLFSKYKRPARLSDPHHDFTARSLKELLSVPDESMQAHHFASLLGPHLPAGTYAEVAYFFPHAVTHLLTHQEDALDLVTPIIGFASTNVEELRDDGLLGSARDALSLCLTALTGSFSVQHFDAACAAKGWGLAYFDLVLKLESVCQATTDLVRFSTHSDIAEHFVDALAHHQAHATKAAWFLAYASSAEDVYSPPNHEPIQALLLSTHLLASAAAIVRDQVVPITKSPTYWNDTFAKLQVAPPTEA